MMLQSLRDISVFQGLMFVLQQVTSPAFPQAKGEKEQPALLLWTSAFVATAGEISDCGFKLEG